MKTARPKNVSCDAVLFKRWIQNCVLVAKKLFGVTPPIVPLPVVVRIGRDAYESTLTSQDKDHYVLVVPVAYLRERGLKSGDRIKLTIEPDLGRQAPELPADLAEFFREHQKTLAQFRSMTIANQRQIVKYIYAVANERGRRNRMEIMAEHIRERTESKRKRAAKTA